jgi:hypothetical protein
MKTYTGNVEITEDNEAEWAIKLKGVQKITGYVWADLGGTIDLPACTAVGGHVVVYNGGNIGLPACTAVGGYVWADNGGKIDLPKKVGNNPRPISEKFASKGYMFADNILSRIVSKRKSGKVIIHKTICIGNRCKVLYVAQRGNLYAHGATPKKAAHDLRYKLSDRDTTKYAKWTLDSVHPIADMIAAYRAITGACEAGTKSWCEGKTLPEKVSVKVAIRLTRGAYGGEKFKAFFDKGVK